METTRRTIEITEEFEKHLDVAFDWYQTHQIDILMEQYHHTAKDETTKQRLLAAKDELFAMTAKDWARKVIGREVQNVLARKISMEVIESTNGPTDKT
jgi:hypothetical protein